MPKEYEVVTTLVFTQTYQAKNEEEARELTRNSFGDEYFLEPLDCEMKVTEIKPKKKCTKKKSV